LERLFWNAAFLPAGKNFANFSEKRLIFLEGLVILLLSGEKWSKSGEKWRR
jgi:hypothetical protein